jgi:WD40 repeat protein
MRISPRRWAPLLLAALLAIAGLAQAAVAPPLPPPDEDEPLPRQAIARLGSARLFHPGAVRLAFAPDGSMLASQGSGGVRLWNAATGAALARLSFADTEGAAIAFSPDGRYLATLSSRDYRIRLWCPFTCRLLRVLPREVPLWGARHLAFSPDSRYLHGTSDGEELLVWDIQTARRAARARPGQAVSASALAGDGTVATAMPGAVRLWGARSQRHGPPLALGPTKVIALTFSADSRFLAVLEAHRATLYDRATGRARRLALGAPSAQPPLFALSPDGKWLAVSTARAALVIHDTTTRRPAWKVGAPSGAANFSALAFAPNSEALAVARGDGAIQLLASATGACLAPRLTFRPSPASALFTPDGAAVITTADDHTIRIWEVRSGKPRLGLKGHTAGVTSLALTADGRTLASGSYDGTIRLWDIKTGTPLRKLNVVNAHNRHTTALAFAPNGKVLAVGGDGGEVKLWDVTRGRPMTAWRRSAGAVSGLAFGPDGKVLYWGTTSEKVVHAWMIAGLRPVRQWPAGGTVALALSADGRTLVTGPWLTMWDTASEKRLFANFFADAGGALAVALAPDGKRLASGGAHGTIDVWDTKTGKAVNLLVGHEGPIGALAFAPGGELLASAGADGTALIWDLRGRARPRPWRGNLDSPHGMCRDLGGNAATVLVAYNGLIRAGDDAVKPLGELLRPVAAPAENERVARLIRALDNDDFEVRERAEVELARRGRHAELALCRALTRKLPLEQYRRIERLLARMAERPLRAEEAPMLRAVWALEGINTPAAHRQLRAGASAPLPAPVRREVVEALKRLAAR